jgi:hypothetical protein
MIEQRFRRDYTGEFVILETRWKDGHNQQTREWIDNPIVNHHISGRAAVIGSRILSHRFQYQRLQRHRGGLLGRKRLQTYGTGDLWRDMRFDFFATTDRAEITEMLAQDYDSSSTVFTTARICIEHPGRFYPIPYLPQIDGLAMPVYLAAFDGHEEVFMLGYCQETPGGSKNWTRDVDQVITAYAGTSFILIGVEGNMPESWRSHANVRCMGIRDFVTYCDI